MTAAPRGGRVPEGVAARVSGHDLAVQALPRVLWDEALHFSAEPADARWRASQAQCFKKARSVEVVRVGLDELVEALRFYQTAGRTGPGEALVVVRRTATVRANALCSVLLDGVQGLLQASVQAVADSGGLRGGGIPPASLGSVRAFVSRAGLVFSDDSPAARRASTAASRDAGLLPSDLVTVTPVQIGQAVGSLLYAIVQDRVRDRDRTLEVLRRFAGAARGRSGESLSGGR